MVIISAGFREIGAEGRKLEQLVRQEQRKFDGMRILGPNCLGLIVPGINLNASFAAASPAKGHIGFISQSGALCTSVLDWALDEGIGFSYFVSVGNMLDVSMGDLIDYFGSATETRSIILYIESISEAREFMSAARAFARTKPIVAYKAGRFAESAQAAASHTGAMAGVDAVYEAAFQRAGIERIFQIEDMFDCAELLARQQPPKGDRLAIITNAGGPGVMTTDALIDRDGELAAITDETMAQLNELLPVCWSHGNPIDVLGDAPPDRFAKAVEIVLKDKNTDAVLVILTPQAMTDPTATAAAVGKAANHAHKPVLAAWMGGRVVAEGIQLLNNAGIPTYNTPEKAVRAFMHLVSYARNLEILHETPKDIPLGFTLDRQRLRGVFDTILTEGGEILSENVSKAFLEAYEIPVTKPQAARSADEAVEVAHRLGYPVVLKVHSPQITHKTDVGGVMLNLSSDDKVRAAFEQITSRAKEKRPDAEIVGVTVQKMVTYPNSFELIMGSKKDPIFGSVIMVGMGGVAAEVFRDRALGLPPLERGPGPPHVGIAQVLAAVEGLPRQARRQHRPPDRDHHAVLLPRGRLSRDQGVGHQSAAGHAGGRDRLGRPRGDRPRPGGPHGPPLRPPRHPAVSRGVRDGAETQGRHAGRAAADQAGRRADVARLAGELLDPVALVPLQLPLQADHPRNGHPLLLHRLRPRAGHRGRGGGGRAAEADRRGPAGGRRRPRRRRIRRDRRRPLARPRPGRTVDRLLPRSGQAPGASSKIVAEVSKDNSRMLATFRNRGFQLNDEQEQDVVLVSKPVP